MRIEILSEAENDLLVGAKFYERRGAGLGEYFLSAKTSVASTRTISNCARARFLDLVLSFSARLSGSAFADTPLRLHAPTPPRPSALGSAAGRH
jgi:hypothetical protein